MSVLRISVSLRWICVLWVVNICTRAPLHQQVSSFNTMDVCASNFIFSTMDQCALNSEFQFQHDGFVCFACVSVPLDSSFNTMDVCASNFSFITMDWSAMNFSFIMMHLCALYSVFRFQLLRTWCSS